VLQKTCSFHHLRPSQHPDPLQDGLGVVGQESKAFCVSSKRFATAALIQAASYTLIRLKVWLEHSEKCETHS